MALALALVGASAVVAVAAGGAGGDLVDALAHVQRADRDEDAHAHEHPGHAGHARGDRTQWPAAEGEVPSSPKGLVDVWNIRIEGSPDAAALEEQGVTIPGSGTLEDPFVIEGYAVRGDLSLKDTDDYYVIRGNYVERELALNWNGDKVHVHHNYVRDLRVNENVERSGDATGGLIELNEIGVVGQIRHYDGVFARNVVGPIPEGFFDPIVEDTGEIVPFFWFDERAVNIDGFGGGVFDANTIHGYVEMQIHGHHHATCFECHTHNHAEGAEHEMEHDHGIRYHKGAFTNNVIDVEKGVAFRYTDRGHAGDDRTARSEPNRELEGPHVHYTDVAITGNTLTGGALVIDVFNADDRYHDGSKSDDAYTHAFLGRMLVEGNSVEYALGDRSLAMSWWEDVGPDGILVRGVTDADLVLKDNVVSVTDGKQESAVAQVPFFGENLAGYASAGIHLQDVDVAKLVVTGNTVRGPFYGVLANDLTQDVHWSLFANAFENVDDELYTTDDVAAEPSSAPE